MHDRPRERLIAGGARTLSDADLVALVLGTGQAGLSARAAALELLEHRPLSDLAWASPGAHRRGPGIGLARAAALVAAFELGRRGAWAPPQRGERCLDPGRVHELLRHAAHAEREGFHVVLLDVRGRLLKALQVAEGSLTQCPVSPRDALRPAVREGAHGVVFVHNHPTAIPPRARRTPTSPTACGPPPSSWACSPATTSSWRPAATTASSRRAGGSADLRMPAGVVLETGAGERSPPLEAPQGAGIRSQGAAKLGNHVTPGCRRDRAAVPHPARAGRPSASRSGPGREVKSSTT